MSTNVPATQWRSNNGLVEYTNVTPSNIADINGDNLVDPTSVEVVDTGVVATLIPATTWEEDDSV